MHWTTAHGIGPDQVTQDVLEAFAHDLEHYGLRSRPREAFLTACRSWNWASSNIPDWPNLVVARDDRRDRYSFAWTAFPASLKQDIDRMVENAVSPDPLSPTSRRPIKRVSAESRTRLLRRYTSALVIRGRDPNALTSIAKLVDIDAVRDGLRFFLDRKDGKITADTHQIAKLLCTLARHHVRVSDAHQTELDQIRKRLDPGRHGMADKNRLTLRNFEDDALVNRFVELPERIAKKYRFEKDIKERDAVKVQIALAIELLTIAPVRIKNLSRIHRDHNLIRIGHGKKEKQHLFFPADDVKTETNLEFELPASTEDLHDLYVERFRPHLIRAPNDYLFPGEADGPKGSACFSNQIADMVERELGVRSLLRRAINALPKTANTEAKRLRLREPDRLVDLGCELMAQAERDTNPSRRKNACQYRDGLQIALLAKRPLRRKNLAMIEIGTHLIRRSPAWWLVFVVEDTKTHTPIDVLFPELLVAALERYLDHYRLLLTSDR